MGTRADLPAGHTPGGSALRALCSPLSAPSSADPALAAGRGLALALPRAEAGHPWSGSSSHRASRRRKSPSRSQPSSTTRRWPRRSAAPTRRAACATAAASASLGSARSRLAGDRQREFTMPRPRDRRKTCSRTTSSSAPHATSAARAARAWRRRSRWWYYNSRRGTHSPRACDGVRTFVQRVRRAVIIL